MRIDLNCDLGEGAPHDAELMPLITSANIACGAHAGDEETMRRTLLLAKEHGVSAGAHPGYMDRENFGRRELSLSPAEIFLLVREQLRALRTLAAEQGSRITHVKPHGALYNQAARDRLIADAIAEAVHDEDPSLMLFGLAGSESMAAAGACRLQAVAEVFADRRYRPDGSLVPRTEADAMITDPAESCDQVLRFIRKEKTDTVCLHGDGPQAVLFAQELRSALHRAGVDVRSLRE